LLLGRSSLAAEASPLSHVSAASPPFLFVHGDRDQTVPLDQSRRMVTALSQAGADARLVVMAGVGHGQYDARGESEILAFFRRRLGGTAP
jgi:dipeptidyl aminopeptidase/acylaminoacyl peptidase